MKTQRVRRRSPDRPDRLGGPRAVERPSTVRSEASATPLWEAHAAQWSLIGSPLRPHPHDLAIAQRAIDSFADDSQWYALLLGVTRELAGLRWPRGATLLAADFSAAMLNKEWRAPAGCTSLAVRCRWQALPVIRGSVSVVLGDGSLSALPNVEAVRAVLAQVAAALRPDGAFVLRAYTRPETPESPWQVLDDLLGGKAHSIHVAKWRLAMALHGPLSSGVVLDRVWKVFRQAVPDSRRLAARTGWSVESVDTIDAYRGSRSRYLFPTLAELRSLLSPWFEEVGCDFPTYELGDRCPTLTLRLR